MATRDPRSLGTSLPREPRVDGSEPPSSQTYTSVEEMLRTLAYAELRAVMVSWARGPVRAPDELVRAAVDHAVADNKPLWHPDATAFGQHLRGLIRTETAGVLFRLSRALGPSPWDRPLAPGQLGDVPGMEVIFHLAGEAAGEVRASEPRSLSTAVLLADYVRSRVARGGRA